MTMMTGELLIIVIPIVVVEVILAILACLEFIGCMVAEMVTRLFGLL